MKKVLLVLGLALCTTALMAQNTKVCLPDAAVKANISTPAERVDYKASIFNKADDQVVKTFTFASDAEVTYGSNAKIKSGDKLTVDGKDTTVAASQAHGRTEANSYWYRINNRDSINGTDFATTFGGYTALGNGILLNYLKNYLGSDNGIDDDNGFMFISLAEYDNGAAINTYFELPTVDLPSNAKVVDVRFRQCYRKYYDRCFIDYKVNNSWNVLEINVTGVDVTVTSQASGQYVATLPPAAVTSGKLDMRFRIYAAGDIPYGYGWAVDNVSVVVPGESARWSFNSDGYLNGFYGTLPQGFAIPMAYGVNVQNRGADDLTGVQLKVDHIDMAGNSTNVLSANQKNIPAGNPQRNYALTINESGFMVKDLALTTDSAYYHADPNYYDQYAASDADVASLNFNRRALPTETIDRNMFAVTATNAQGKVAELDTMSYYVSPYVEEKPEYGITVPGYRWANDNSVVPSKSEFAYQFSGNYIGDDPDGHHQYEAGYQLFTRFNSPSVIPTDENGEPWVFRGIELVTSTNLTSAEVQGSRIGFTFLTWLWADTAYNLYYINNFSGHASDEVFEITANSAPEELDYGYSAPGTPYYAYNIAFPAQPEIEPNTSYYFGYNIVEETGKFSVAGVSNYYYENADSTTRYSAVDELKPWARQFSPLYKIYDVYAYDGTAGRAISGWNITRYPMIRAIVGPKMEVPTYEVEVLPGEEDEDGNESYWVLYGNQNVVDDVVTLNEGMSGIFYVTPGTYAEAGDGDPTGWVIDEIYVDGVSIPLEDNDDVVASDWSGYWPGHGPEDKEDWGPAIERNRYGVYIRNINANHTISAKASKHELSISEIEERVKIGIAPNPASSQVSVNVMGLNGMVNCSILDMSGREVYTTSFNAGSEQTISLSNIPAGAYFVRITNDKVSKVEKLIVR